MKKLTNKFFSALIRFFAYIHCPLIRLRFPECFMFRAIVDAIILKQPIILKHLLQSIGSDLLYHLRHFYEPQFLIEVAFLVEDTIYLEIILDNHTGLRILKNTQKDIIPLFFCKVLQRLGERNVHASIKHVEVLFSKLGNCGRHFLLWQDEQGVSVVIASVLFDHPDCCKFLLKKAREEGVLTKVFSQNFEDSNPLQVAVLGHKFAPAYAILDEIKSDPNLFETLTDDPNVLFFCMAFYCLDNDDIDTFRFTIEKIEKLGLCNDYTMFARFPELIQHHNGISGGFFDLYYSVASKYWAPSALCLQRDRYGLSPIDYATGILYKNRPKSFHRLMENFRKLLAIATNENFLKDLLLQRSAHGKSILMLAVTAGNEICVMEILEQLRSIKQLHSLIHAKDDDRLDVFGIIEETSSSELRERQRRCIDIVKSFCRVDELENK